MALGTGESEGKDGGLTDVFLMRDQIAGNEHGVAITEKPIPLLNGALVSGHNMPITAKR